MSCATRFFILLTTPFPLLNPRPSLLRFRLCHLARNPRVSPSSIASLSTFTLSPSSSRRQLSLPVKASREIHTQTSTVWDDNFAEPSGGSSRWPEWSKLVELVTSNGYFNRIVPEDDEFVTTEDLSDDFIKTARACLAFARDMPNLLGSLPRRDIEVVVENGSAFLFNNAQESAMRMKSFLAGDKSNVLHKACPVDLMRFLLSYTSNPTLSLDRNCVYNKEQVESSIRNLLTGLANVSYSAPQSNFPGSVLKQFPESHGQSPRAFGQNIEMKRGDWVCPRCNFMNFARNVKCLECEEARPKRQLTGGEWECPQCDFYNYGRNLVCLRCDCKRPGEISFSTSNNSADYGNGGCANKVDLNSRLAANEEKAERWFSKVSQQDSTSDLNKAITDDDFPEIMPLRKGVNRFVVSTRKTPLERRLANAQYLRNLENDGASEGHDRQTGGVNKPHDTTITRSLDEILGRVSDGAAAETMSTSTGQNDGMESRPVSNLGTTRQYGSPKGSSSNYVPLPADMFAKKPQSSEMEENEKPVIHNHMTVGSEATEQKAPASLSSQSDMSGNSSMLSQKPETGMDNKDREKEQAEKSERWFKRVAELHDVTDLASAISDEDFPEIMPMRKGENRFVVSKKKDRSLTSPMYKRRMAMEQAGNTNFVPFVPFPPDYFAKKDKQQHDGAYSADEVSSEASVSVTSEKLPGKADSNLPDRGYEQPTENRQSTIGSWSSNSYGENSTERTAGAIFGAQNSENSAQNFVNPQATGNNRSSGYGEVRNVSQTTNLKGSSPTPFEDRNPRDGWTGKSLEGSAVKEPDPLDMSEEAKAERWFRRAAQIKDISELSQIPDEDFPSIMPMRKGHNRFVVSKRKTPLERRLTSSQYRRNLPVVSSDPLKKENENS